MVDVLLSIALLALLIAVVVGMLRLNHLLAVAMLSGIYSLLIATFFTVFDAVDVAFTEAAVGAGISTVLMLCSLSLTSPRGRGRSDQAGLAIVVCVFVAGLLVYASMDFVLVGTVDSAVQTHVAAAYLEQTPEKIDVPNLVTAVLASFRGYDTLGETVVIFTAALCVFGLIGVSGRKRLVMDEEEDGKPSGHDMTHYVVLRVTAKIVIPVVLLYALYVQFHGDYGPGGGFQAGVIFAVGIILYSLIFGLDRARAAVFAGRRVPQWCVAAGVLLYAGVGVAGMLLGGSFLNYNLLLHDPVHGQHLGIILVEFGVGLTVAGVMISVYLAFAGRGRRVQDSAGRS